MIFTFGTITEGSREAVARIQEMIDSVEKQNMPEYEIVIVGGENHYAARSNVRHIAFDELVKRNWITRKKNLIAQNARYEHLVLFHDYYRFESGWYRGYLSFGSSWDICQNICLDIDGDRYYDWVLWDHPTAPRYALADPEDQEIGRYLYVPGHYFVVKRDAMLAVPLNETLTWGESEDIEWTYRLRAAGLVYRMNARSSVRHQKPFRGYEQK